MKKLYLFTLVAGAAVATAFAAPIVQEAKAKPAAAPAGARVVFEGEKPQVKPLVIEAEKAKGCTHEGHSMDTTDQSLMIDSGGGISNVVVTVDAPGAKLVVPEKPVELDQKSCRYEPHITIVPAGTTVEYANSDSVSHNVHIYANKNEAFNQTIGAGAKASRKYDKAESIEIKCDIHPWMNAYLVVVDTPYYAVTGADGSFSVPGLPAGEYKAKFWHEKLGKTDAQIKVGADGKIEPIEVKMGVEKKGGGRKR